LTSHGDHGLTGQQSDIRTLDGGVVEGSPNQMVGNQRTETVLPARFESELEG
jgi:hypothetical protein